MAAGYGSQSTRSHGGVTMERHQLLLAAQLEPSALVANGGVLVSRT
jgi:hypothetical protein